MSVEDIIKASIADLPGRDSDGDSGGSESVDTSVDDGGAADDAADVGDSGGEAVADPVLSEESIQTSDIPAPEVVAEPVKELSETEKLLEEEGYKKDRPDGKENRIPHSRTVKIIDNQQRKWAEEITGALIPAGMKPLEAVKAHVAKIPELETQLKAHTEEAANYNHVRKIMDNNPEQFIGMLLEVHPDYAKYFRHGGEEPAKEAASTVDADMPQPDLDLGDGRVTYSVEGWAKREAWAMANLKKQIVAEQETRLAPVIEEFQAKQRIAEAIPRLQKLRDDARANWPGFTEHESEVLAAVKANRSYSLHDAYISVISTKHKAALEAAEAKVKEAEANVLKKIKAAPTSTSQAVGGTKLTVADPNKPRSVEDIIRDSIKDLKR